MYLPNYNPDELKCSNEYVFYLFKRFDLRHLRSIYLTLDISSITPIESFFTFLKVIYCQAVAAINWQISLGNPFVHPKTVESIFKYFFSRVEQDCLQQWNRFLNNPVVSPYIFKERFIVLPNGETLTIETFLQLLATANAMYVSAIPPSNGGYVQPDGSINYDSGDRSRALLPKSRCQRCWPRLCACCTIL